MTIRTIILFALQTSLLMMVFGFGLRASIDDVLYVLKRPWLFARSFTAMFVVMPVVVIALVELIHLRPATEVCLVALAISPVPPVLPNRLIKAGGRRSYAFGLLATMAALSIVVVPLASRAIGWYIGKPLDMAPAAIAKMVGVAVLLPFALGMVFRARWPDVAARIVRPSALLGTVLLWMVVLSLVASNFGGLVAVAGNGTVAALAGFTLIGLALGHLFAGADPSDRMVLAVSTATRHPGIALTLATANFPDEQFGSTILLYLLVSLVVSIPYMHWVEWRRLTSASSPDTSPRA